MKQYRQRTACQRRDHESTAGQARVPLITSNRHPGGDIEITAKTRYSIPNPTSIIHNPKFQIQNPVRRHAIGVLALLLLLAWLILWLYPTGGSVGAEYLKEACGKMGLLAAVVWLAYDEVQRLPLWTLPLLLVFLIVLIKWPKWLWLAVPILLAAALLRPRISRRR